MVPDAYSWQVREPEQLPARPQVVTDWVSHSLSGSVPTVIASQNPSRPLPLQCSHVPVQPVSQQTPSAQWPVLHSLLPVQAWPWSFRHTLVLLQT